MADVISDLVSSGSTLKMNHLKEIAVITHSQAVVIANHESYSTRRDEIDELVSAMRSVMDAENKKYLMADVPDGRHWTKCASTSPGSPAPPS